MSGGDLKREILLNTIKADAANGTNNATDILHRQYPGLSSVDCEEIAATICAALTTENTEKVSLVVTAPPSFRINAKPTLTVVQSMLEGAKRNILITGYSLSSYFSELTVVPDVLRKSRGPVVGGRFQSVDCMMPSSRDMSR